MSFGFTDTVFKCLYRLGNNFGEIDMFTFSEEEVIMYALSLLWNSKHITPIVLKPNNAIAFNPMGEQHNTPIL